MVWGCMTTRGTGELRFIEVPTCTVTLWSKRWCPPFRNCVERQFYNITATPNTPPNGTALLMKLKVMSGQICLQTWTLLSTCGASSSGRWRSTMSLTSSSSMMSLWRSGRGCQQQLVWYCPLRRFFFFAEMWGVYSLLWDTVHTYIHILYYYNKKSDKQLKAL